VTHPAYGSITQIAWVTEDIDATERTLTGLCGAGRWTRMPDVDFSNVCEYRFTPADFAAHISLTYLGDMQLELIQPTRGNSIYTEFLGDRGPGLHHVCFEPEDYPGAILAARSSGIDIPQLGDMGSIRFAYLDCAFAGIPCIEIAEVGDDMRAFYDYVKAQARRGR